MSGTDANYNSTFSYDGNGFLTSVSIADGWPRTVSFVNDLEGRVLQRHEADGNTSTGDPHELHYYFGGIQLGDVSNNGTSDIDYAASIAQQTAASRPTPGRSSNSGDTIPNLTAADPPGSGGGVAADALEKLRRASSVGPNSRLSFRIEGACSHARHRTDRHLRGLVRARARHDPNVVR